jgi:membrane associated rhomboid family serine protease
MMPGEPGISWQAHIGGFLGGALAARGFRTSRRLPSADARNR